MQEQAIFIEALEKAPPAERAAFLDRACAGDPALRQRVERLLQRHEQIGSFLQPADPRACVTVDEPVWPSTSSTRVVGWSAPPRAATG